MLLILALGLLGSCASPLKHLNTAEVKTPSDLDKIAQTYYEYRQYANAIRVYKKLLDNYSKRIDRYEKQLAWATYEIGFCYLITNQYTKALEYFKKVLTDYSTLAARTLAKQRIEEIQKIKNPKKKQKQAAKGTSS